MILIPVVSVFTISRMCISPEFFQFDFSSKQSRFLRFSTGILIHEQNVYNDLTVTSNYIKKHNVNRYS